MVLNNIEKLLEKYDNAETSLKEEAQLRAYFESDNVSPHLEHYKPMFVYFSQSQKEQYTKDVPLKPKRTNLYRWISVAAVAVLMLGFIIPQVLGPSQEELKQQELAMETYNKTMEALSLVSLGMKEGKQQLNSLAMVSDNFNQGIKGANKLSEFTKTTNRIFKKSNTQKLEIMKSQIHENKTNKIKTMSKKLILVMAIVLAPMLSSAQSIFDKFEDMPEVASVIVNQKMFSMIASIDVDMDDPEAQEYMDMVKKITGLKVFTTGDEKVSADMKATVNKYLKSSDLEELMRMKDGAQTVKFYVKEGKDENHVKELLMFVSGLKELTEGQDIEINGKKREFESVLLTLTGDIDLRQVSKITNQMEIPGGDQLKKAGKDKN